MKGQLHGAAAKINSGLCVLNATSTKSAKQEVDGHPSKDTLIGASHDFDTVCAN